MAKKPEAQQVAEVGYAVRGLNGGYSDCNGIGDTSCAGDALTCTIYDSVSEALDSIEAEGLDTDDLEIMRITRATAVVVTPFKKCDEALAEREANREPGDSHYEDHGSVRHELQDASGVWRR